MSSSTAPDASPRSTYRVQLHAGFTFVDAAAVVPYLDDLGISHLYCSPYLQAAPGSTHGYDVVDHSRLNRELGGDEGHRAMTQALAERGMGQVLDIVPNHMALAGRNNPWWWDVLENGPSSPYASYFDIDWDPPERKLIATVLVPVLGDHYGRVLESGELRLEREGGKFVARYHEHEAPISPRSIGDLVARAAERSGSAELATLAQALSDLPHALRTDREAVERRHREKEELAARLGRLCAEDDGVAAALDAEVKELNSDPDLLDVLLTRQNFRFAYWRTAVEELDYRRFFDINTLAAVRMEDPRVFEDTHRLVVRLVADGIVDGLRIDHVDGLRDPEQYLRRLADATGGAHVVVEKILEPGERLPASWPVAGTSGYDFLNRVNGLFVDPAAEEPLTAAYSRFTGEPSDYAEVVHEAKHLVLERSLAADVERLTVLLGFVAEGQRRYRDYTRTQLREVLIETAASFPVYRTYVQAGRPPRPEDEAVVELATEEARRRRPEHDPELFGFLAEVLLGRLTGDMEAEVAARFQQLTAPVMAKGVEDTAFYRFNRLVSLNEVGGDPGHFGTTPEAFHEAMAAAAHDWPNAMLTLSTHDTKRSADVRARINALTTIPGVWEEALWRWAHLNERHRTAGLPDRNAEYLLYQTLVGAWPVSADRAVAYMEKAAREAKLHTSWTEPDSAYDEALRKFVEGVVADGEFTADLEAFLEEHEIVPRGHINSLAQTTILLTAPGYPDVYQGTEMWDFSLVDPDNRRPVDYAVRRGLLAEVRKDEAPPVLDGDHSGRSKLWLVQALLRERVRRPECFSGEAGYEPVRCAEGSFAFRRADLVVAVPRFGVPVDRASVEVPAGEWRDITAGLPVAVFVR